MMRDMFIRVGGAIDACGRVLEFFSPVVGQSTMGGQRYCACVGISTNNHGGRRTHGKSLPLNGHLKIPVLFHLG